MATGNQQRDVGRIPLYRGDRRRAHRWPCGTPVLYRTGGQKRTVAINRVQWNGDTQTEEITEVLYRSESGDPVLLFANLDDVPTLADTQVVVTDSYGNTTSWYPCLDEQFHLVPTSRPTAATSPVTLQSMAGKASRRSFAMARRQLGGDDGPRPGGSKTMGWDG